MLQRWQKNSKNDVLIAVKRKSLPRMCKSDNKVKVCVGIHVCVCILYVDKKVSNLTKWGSDWSYFFSSKCFLENLNSPLLSESLLTQPCSPYSTFFLTTPMARYKHNTTATILYIGTKYHIFVLFCHWEQRQAAMTLLNLELSMSMFTKAGKTWWSSWWKDCCDVF